MSLPPKRQLLTSIFSSIPTTNNPSASGSNPLKAFGQDKSVRDIFVTLHVLFPNELLPALDLLDRGLVTRFVVKPEQLAVEDGPPLAANESGAFSPYIYYVRSSAASSSSSHARSRYHDPEASLANITHYQVRPYAWNCSCPAFAFSAFPASGYEASNGTSVTMHAVKSGEEEMAELFSITGANDDSSTKDVGASGHDWSVGGLTNGNDAPACKHLLACALVEYGQGMFESLMQEREVSVEEACGWTAGWGG